MAKPLILVTSGRQRRAAARSEIQTINTGVDIDYIDSLVAAGGAPVILPCMPDKAVAAAAVNAADGIVLTGGGDVMSLAYGEEPHPSCMYQDPVRDEIELEVVRLALARNLPILGICRGLQVLNIAFGGTLVQDVVSQVKGAVKHYAHGLTPVLMHSIDVTEDSQLARIFGRTSLPVNSYHHQAAKDIGKGLRANCWARDGVVEGLEAADGRPIVAVQFHPEEVALEHAEFLKLFQWIVRESSSAKLPKSSPAEPPALVNA
ncbi:MAG TPA: gamma-glutamyl-gamma-aminobutyrate hydrolase family protein [Capsulimonadaceae bacterium]|nr:gamma-glutamyl-gamma-aminobutyrate hydrolase family protein [Capsulimonadaceae bacterium]